MRRDHPILGCIGSLLLIPGIALLAAPYAAQSQSTGWTDPLTLFETTGRASEAEVAADAFGVVHVFWAYGAPGLKDEGAGQSIYYAGQDGDRWSKPIDVLVSPGGRVARMPDVVADRKGYLHIVWSGGNAIFYSRAYGPQAGSPWGWSEPIAWQPGATTLEPAIAADGLGGLYVVWTQADRGLVFTRSEDGGHAWSEPKAIFEIGGGELARWGRVAVDDGGRLHVVMTHSLVDPQGAAERGDPNYLYYLSSDDLGESWSQPFLVTEQPDFGEVNVATHGPNDVHLAWNGRAGRHGRYHRWSDDGGQSWSPIGEILAPSPRNSLGTGGLTGFPSLVIDSTGVVHLVSATGGGEYYFSWRDGVWSEPQLISSGLDGRGMTGEARSLEQPSLALSEGNQLHVVFHDGFERIWYTRTEVDAPHEAPRPLPTLTVRPSPAKPQVESSPVAPGSATVTPHSVLGGTQPSTTTRNRVDPLLAGLVPVILVILVVVAASLKRRR